MPGGHAVSEEKRAIESIGSFIEPGGRGGGCL